MDNLLAEIAGRHFQNIPANTDAVVARPFLGPSRRNISPGISETDQFQEEMVLELYTDNHLITTIHYHTDHTCITH